MIKDSGRFVIGLTALVGGWTTCTTAVVTTPYPITLEVAGVVGVIFGMVCLHRSIREVE
jgi:uncharacterized membrane-anchored protein